MGWLRRIFKREDEDDFIPEDITIELHKIDSWIEKRLGSSFEKIQPDIQSSMESLEKLQDVLDDQLSKLGKEDLHNPKISEREMQLMEGNRESYIQHHRLFIQQSAIPEKLDFRKTSNFCEKFEQLLLRLAKSTGRSHMVMTEFFLHNANDINKTIKKMSDLSSSIKEKMEDYDIDLKKNETLLRAVNELQSKSHHLRELDQDLILLQKKLANSRKMKQKLEKSIDVLKQGDSYAEFKGLDGEKAVCYEKMKSVETQLHELFSPISKAMRKYDRIAFENADVLKNYLDDATKALESDENLKILSLLSSMRSSVDDEKLGFKDKDKERMLAKIDKVTKESLQDLRKTYVSSKEKIRETQSKMKNIRALQELNDINYKVEHVDNQIELLTDKIDKGNKIKEKIDIPRMKKEVEKLVSDYFNISLTILEDDDPRIHK